MYDIHRIASLNLGNCSTVLAFNFVACKTEAGEE